MTRAEAVVWLLGPKRFRLLRHDPTGVSGPGHIADGVMFSDGTCALRWRSAHRSTAIYATHEELMAIHGHDGMTGCDWFDERVSEVAQRGARDCYQDSCENCPFASIGGLDLRDSPTSPAYITPPDHGEYRRGYLAQAALLYGDDWRTCGFGWKRALTVGAAPEAT